MRQLRNSILLMALCFFASEITLFGQQKSDSTQRTVFDQDFRKGESSTVKVLVLIENGQLNISGNHKQLASIQFNYLNKFWSPAASYLEEAGMGKLVVRSNASLPFPEKEKLNQCTMLLNDKIDYQLAIELGAGIGKIDLKNYNIQKALFRLGAGKFDIDLSDTPLQSLKVQAGAGEVLLDVSGKRTNTLKAEIIAGVGQMTIIVPANYPVTLNIKGLLGNVDAKGFSKSGNTYSIHGDSAKLPALNIELTGGIGNIVIEQK